MPANGSVHIDNTVKDLDKVHQTDVVYMDFAKAFDSVSHKLLIMELRNHGICGNVSWFDSYLSSRLQRVVIAGRKFDWLSVTSGVPQGSILEPLMFITHIDDLKICLCADDAKMYIK